MSDELFQMLNRGTFRDTGVDPNATIHQQLPGYGNIQPSPFIIPAPSVYGDGSDGDVTIAADTTLTRDMYYNTLTVNAGKSLNTASFMVHVKTTLVNNGVIHSNGGDASGTTGGATGNPLRTTGLSAPGGAGRTTGGVGNVGNNSTNTFGGAGGNGGTVGANTGGTGGTASAPAAGYGGMRSAQGLLGAMFSGTASAVLNQGGSGGGGGFSTGTSSGAGGGGGGVVYLLAKTIDNSAGIIRANGGAGSAAVGGNAGGGGGGGGGTVILIYSTLSSGTEQANGGAGGAGTGTGAAGASGSAGTVIEMVNA